MPKNKFSTHEPMHTKSKTGEPGKFNYAEHLSTIDVKLIEPPTIEQLRGIVSVFMMNTWNDKLKYEFNEQDIDNCIYELFAGNILPTGMETINLTWTVSGLDMIDTTHLIRHRLFSFSAQTHADRDMRNDTMLIPASILHSKYFERYINIADEAKRLYMDMTDSGEVCCLDTRTIMPRCFEHFYIVRSTIKDLIAFCQLRGDEQIQTQSDNILAMKLWLEVLKQYPFLKGLVDFKKQDVFYVKQSKAGKTNIFPPNEKNDCFDWSDGQFIHDKHRDEFIGGVVYKTIRANLLAQIDAI